MRTNPEPHWLDRDGTLLNGPTSNCCERIADAYAWLCSPHWQEGLKRYPIFAEVGRYALSYGYRLHPAATRELLGDPERFSTLSSS